VVKQTIIIKNTLREGLGNDVDLLVAANKEGRDRRSDSESLGRDELVEKVFRRTVQDCRREMAEVGGRHVRAIDSDTIAQEGQRRGILWNRSFFFFFLIGLVAIK